jgi:alpha-L-fucosidase 2
MLTNPTLRVRLFCLCLPLLMTSIHAEDFKDVEYAQVGKVTLRFDAHIPDGKGPFPTAILIHGGAWVAGDRVHNVKPLMKPLSDANIAWFSISYRLAADVLRNPVAAVMQMGSAETDVRRAIAYVRDHAAEYRVNPNKIVLIGESSGGQLAAMAALRPDSGAAVQGVVALYTPSDLAMLMKTTSMIPDSVRDAVKGTVFDGLLIAGLNEFSPINSVNEKAPPFLLIHGTDDIVVPYAQSQRFCDKLRESKVSCELYTVNGGGHGVRGWEALNHTDYKAPMVRWIQKTLALPYPIGSTVSSR